MSERINFGVLRESCRSCGASVVWATTDNDRPVMVNIKPTPLGNVVLGMHGGKLRASVLGRNQAVGAREHGKELYAFHFVDCPDADQHRRKGRHR